MAQKTATNKKRSSPTQAPEGWPEGCWYTDVDCDGDATLFRDAVQLSRVQNPELHNYEGNEVLRRQVELRMAHAEDIARMMAANRGRGKGDAILRVALKRFGNVEKQAEENLRNLNELKSEIGSAKPTAEQAEMLRAFEYAEETLALIRALRDVFFNFSGDIQSYIQATASAHNKFMARIFDCRGEMDKVNEMIGHMRKPNGATGKRKRRKQSQKKATASNEDSNPAASDAEDAEENDDE